MLAILDKKFAQNSTYITLIITLKIGNKMKSLGPLVNAKMHSRDCARGNNHSSTNVTRFHNIVN